MFLGKKKKQEKPSQCRLDLFCKKYILRRETFLNVCRFSAGQFIVVLNCRFITDWTKL